MLLDLDAIFDPERRTDSQPGRLDRTASLPPEWHLLWDERAAIMEYDGGLHRERAEALALTDILRQMDELSVQTNTEGEE